MSDIDSTKLQEYVRRRRDEQNLGLGLLGGLLGAIVGATLWGLITALTGYQIGWMAIGVGFLTGIGVRVLGKGIDPVFGIAGAVLSLAGCVVGNVLAAMIGVSMHQHIPFANIAAKMTPSIAWQILVAGFSPLDLLFYGFAIYFGYRYSFQGITAEELEALKGQPASPP